MKFKRNIWFSSDLHLEHWNCNKFCNRGFNTLDEMNFGIIESINKYVKEDHTLYLLGDIIWSTGDFLILNKLICKDIRLVRGNHDDSNYNKFLKNNIKIVCEEMIIKIGKNRVLLSHYPYKYRFWKGLFTNIKNYFNKGYWPTKNRFINYPENKGLFLLHGHHHGGDIIHEKQFNVAWDIHKRPINIQEIEEFIQKNS